ncbi:methyltransferase domain-containing protein [bacterium]|nr:methyltransferase domain-containing protein [bacterium]
MKELALNQAQTRAKEGTYAFSRLKDKQLELSRLKKQGTILPGLELEYLVRHGLTPDMKVLDAACGPGTTTSLIHDFLESGTVIGVDINDDLLREATAHASLNRQPITFLKADIYDLPFEEEFDYIYCRFLFQHLADPSQAIASLLRVLKPGGILHIIDVNDEWLFLDPPVPAFDALCDLALKHQAEQGGNRLVGRYLRNLMAKQGTIDMQSEIVAFNSDLIGIETFLQITTIFKVEQILALETDDDPKALVDEILATVREKEIFGMAGVFSVSGKKNV